ncbi:MAG: plasmid replication initiator TrfA [Methylomagnum sp.]
MGSRMMYELCEKHGIDLESPWPPQFPESERSAAPKAPTKPTAAPAKPLAKVIQFPLLLTDDTRAVSNPLIRSALFAAIQGKDRQLLNDCEIATVDGWKVIFSGEQFNQDDKDTFIQIVFMVRHRPFGEYVVIPAHALLKGLGRSTGGDHHQQLKDEIERLVKGTLKIIGKDCDYIGHLIDDAIQDKTSKHWIIRLNPKFAALFTESSYTVINWEQRKKLKRKDLARWLQLELASHAAPFPRGVEYYREKSGSRTARLGDFRKKLRTALDDLKANGDINGWAIDAADLVHIERTPAPTQGRHLAKK